MDWPAAASAVSIPNHATKNEEQHSRTPSSGSICRICYGGDEEPLITPCLCSGSMRFVHESCLLTWLRTSSNRCEICKIGFQFSKTVLPYGERLNPYITTWHLAWVVKELVVLDWFHFLQTIFIIVSHMIINRMASFDLVYQFALIGMIEICFYGLNIFSCFFLLYYERWARLNVVVHVLNFDECADGSISLILRMLERCAKLLRRNRRLNDIVDAIEEAEINFGPVNNLPDEPVGA